MTCGCGRSPDGCRGWHALTEEEYQTEYAKYLEEEQGQLTVTEVEHYTDKLFRFRVKKPDSYSFIPGEFTMIGMGDGGVKRAYSITSVPTDDFLEFYSIKVPNGPLTSQLKNIKPGDTIEVGDKPTGTLILPNLTPGGNLWLLATGTGIAPFISLVRHPETRQMFDNITVVWSVRTVDELASYNEMLDSSGIDYIPVVTRDDTWFGERSRITNLIQSGTIFESATPDEDKVMLCGNMDFNNDIKTLLLERGWTEGNKKAAGTFVLERAFVG